MDKKTVDIEDFILEEVDNIISKPSYNNEIITRDLDKIEQHKKALNNKRTKIGESLVNKNVKVPQKFKKISEVIGSKKVHSFLFDLLFYGFAEYDDKVEILVEDSKNFYLKINSSINKDGDITFQEELYATEEIIQQVINYESDLLNNCP